MTGGGIGGGFGSGRGGIGGGPGNGGVSPGGSGCGKGAPSAQRNILLITCCSYGDVVLVWNPVKNVELPSAAQEEEPGTTSTSAVRCQLGAAHSNIDTRFS
jgi:hypothetical protein